MILYKYRDWKEDYYKEILSENKIYIPKVSEINDPFDFKIPPNFDLLNSSKKKGEFISRFMNSVESEPQYQALSIEEKKTVYENTFPNNDIDENFKYRFIELRNKNYKEHYGIFSLSKKWDSILMWTHYASNHQGFCVGFDSNVITNTLFFGLGGPVKYQIEFPQIDPLKFETDDIETIKQQCFTKAKDWEYEKEYRFVKLWYPKVPDNSEEQKLQLPVGCIQEIILGLKISDERQNEILKIAKKLNVPVYKINKAEKEFAFIRTKVN